MNAQDEMYGSQFLMSAGRGEASEDQRSKLIRFVSDHFYSVLLVSDAVLCRETQDNELVSRRRRCFCLKKPDVTLVP